MPPEQKQSTDRPEGWSIREATLARELLLSGRGLHTGRKVHVRILPRTGLKKDRGILFRRIAKGETIAEVQTAYGPWRKQPMCSSLRSKNGVLFRTVEHLLASLLLCEIDHAIVEMDAEELPILDGGALRWCRAIHDCGRLEQAKFKRFIKITKSFEYIFGEASSYRIEPAPEYRIDCTVNIRGFAPMAWSGQLTPSSFISEIAPARSYGHLLGALPAVVFGYLSNRPILRGARFSSVAAIFNNKVLGGMLLPDEFARHRVLDMAGDFAIAGAPLLGRVQVVQPSHRRNQKFMRTFLKENKDSWEWRSFQ